MVDFRRTPKPRNYLAQREQWRLLLLVMGLGLVVLLMIEAGKPDRWRWITLGGDGSRAGSASASDEPIDTRVESRPTRGGIPGTFRSPAPAPDQAEVDTTGRYFPGVRPEYLQSVRDDTAFRPEEQKAWFNLLGILKRTDEKTLARRSTGRATFAQLFKQSNEYRGELVTIRGTARRANPLPALENEHGIKRLHQVWVSPDDNPSSPMVVCCLYLPEGFPTGMEIEAKVEIPGFYFKRWVYRGGDSLRRAPTLVARTVHWERPPRPAEAEGPPVRPGALLIVIGLAAGITILMTVYVYMRTRPARSHEPGELPKLDVLGDARSPTDAVPPPETSVGQQPN